MSEREGKWGYVRMMKFLEVLRAFPIIWDKTLPEYSTTSLRKVAYEAIGKAMNVKSEKIKRKLHTLRTQYSKENKMLRMDPNYKVKWRLYYEFNDIFGDSQDKTMPISIDELSDSDNDYTTTHSYNDNFADGIEDDTNIDKGMEDVEYLCNQENLIEIGDESESEVLFENLIEGDSDKLIQNCLIDPDEHAIYYERAQNRQDKKRPKSDAKSVKTETDDENLLNSQNLRDEHTVFGEEVANELRLLNDYKSIQLALKCRIMRALLESNEALHRQLWTK